MVKIFCHLIFLLCCFVAAFAQNEDPKGRLAISQQHKVTESIPTVLRESYSNYLSGNSGIAAAKIRKIEMIIENDPILISHPSNSLNAELKAIEQLARNIELEQEFPLSDLEGRFASLLYHVALQNLQALTAENAKVIFENSLPQIGEYLNWSRKSASLPLQESLEKSRLILSRLKAGQQVSALEIEAARDTLLKAL